MFLIRGFVFTYEAVRDWEVMLSEHRNLAAAKRFFRSAKAVTGAIPDRVTTDGHDAPSRTLSRCRSRCLGATSPQHAASGFHP
jgi:transposase-like protein